MKQNYTVELNEEYAKKCKVNPEQIQLLKERFEMSNTLKLSGLKLLDFVGVSKFFYIIKGQEGQQASVARSAKDVCLHLSYSLSFTVEKQMAWAKNASGFFKPDIVKTFEYQKNEECFKNIKKKPYKRDEFEHYAPDGPTGNIEGKYISRTKYYSDKAEYATNSERPSNILKRNAWVKKRYKQLKKNGMIKAIEQIVDELKRKSIGSLEGRLYSFDTIRHILNL